MRAGYDCEEKLDTMESGGVGKRSKPGGSTAGRDPMSVSSNVQACSGNRRHDGRALRFENGNDGVLSAFTNARGMRVPGNVVAEATTAAAAMEKLELVGRNIGMLLKNHKILVITKLKKLNGLHDSFTLEQTSSDKTRFDPCSVSSCSCCSHCPQFPLYLPFRAETFIKQSKPHICFHVWVL